MDDPDLRAALGRLEPRVLDQLRRLLIADHAERDRIAELLLRRRTDLTDDLADLVDMLSLAADERRRLVRILGELEAGA